MTLSRWLRARGCGVGAMIVLSGVGVLVLAGCASFGAAGNQDTIDASDQAASDLQDGLAAIPGISDAYVAYQDNITLQAHLEVSVEVADATQVDATVQVLERAVWLSDIDPLLSMDLTVVTPKGRPGVTQEYDLQDEATVDGLVDRWGERP